MMQTVYIGLGTNVGDRWEHLSLAVDALGRLGDPTTLQVSPIYETPPMGPEGQDSYLNAVASLLTTSPPGVLLDELGRIEHAAGRAPRDQRVKWGPRELDLDLLLYDDQIIQSEGLTVPHPEMHHRWFVLRPLADLAPRVLHPVFGKTIEQLLAELDNDAAGAAPGRAVGMLAGR
jgi:dihydroneopterin aldolase/2-amino-4-hydroxy-6-hydroxymethyldihydropteridine diphosphokinase